MNLFQVGERALYNRLLASHPQGSRQSQEAQENREPKGRQPDDRRGGDRGLHIDAHGNQQADHADLRSPKPPGNMAATPTSKATLNTNMICNSDSGLPNASIS